MARLVFVLWVGTAVNSNMHTAEVKNHWEVYTNTLNSNWLKRPWIQCQFWVLRLWVQCVVTGTNVKPATGMLIPLNHSLPAWLSDYPFFSILYVLLKKHNAWHYSSFADFQKETLSGTGRVCVSFVQCIACSFNWGIGLSQLESTVKNSIFNTTWATNHKKEGLNLGLFRHQHFLDTNMCVMLLN